MRKLFIVKILLLLVLHAEAQDSTKLPRPDLDYFTNGFNDAGALVVAPIHWNGWQFLEFGGVIGISTAISTQDRVIHDFAQKNRTSLSNNISHYGFTHWGDGLYSMPLMGCFYLYGTLEKDARSRETALLGVETFVVSGSYAGIWKQLIHRHRPYQTDNPYVIDGPFKWEGILSEYNSYPSGHTQAVFSVATIVASEYHDKLWVQILSYSIAGLCGISRIHDNDHWASDVFGAAAFGIANGRFLYKESKKESTSTIPSLVGCRGKCFATAF